MELQIDMMSYRSLSFIHAGRADFNGFFSKAALQVDSGQLSGFWDSLTIQHVELQIDMMSYRSLSFIHVGRADFNIRTQLL